MKITLSLCLSKSASSKFARLAQLTVAAPLTILFSGHLYAQSEESASSMAVFPPVTPPSVWSPLVTVDDNDGEVKIPFSSSEYNAMIYSNVWSGEGLLCGVAGTAVGLLPSDYRKFIGVRGEAGYGKNGYNYGLYGKLNGNRWGAALFSTVYANDYPIMGKQYAGYFHGDVNVAGDLNAEGCITAGSIYGYMPSQDACAPTLAEYSPVSERLACVGTSRFEAPSSFMSSGTDRTDDATELHYGLTAQDVEEYFPEIVKTSDDGTKLVNYMELIPLLVQAINELKAEIDELKGVRSPSVPMKAPAAQATGIQSTTAATDGTANVYDLQGRKASAATKQGVVIRDGQKVWVK